jgi:hypothetical protein
VPVTARISNVASFATRRSATLLRIRTSLLGRKKRFVLAVLVLTRMRKNLCGSKKEPHAEEAARGAAVSKHAGWSSSP